MGGKVRQAHRVGREIHRLIAGRSKPADFFGIGGDVVDFLGGKGNGQQVVDHIGLERLDLCPQNLFDVVVAKAVFLGPFFLQPLIIPHGIANIVPVKFQNGFEDVGGIKAIF